MYFQSPSESSLWDFFSHPNVFIEVEQLTIFQTILISFRCSGVKCISVFTAVISISLLLIYGENHYSTSYG